MLENRGINGKRNTIRDDVKALNDAGYEILANIGPSNSKLYHYGARPFDEPELKLLTYCRKGVIKLFFIWAAATQLECDISC